MAVKRVHGCGCKRNGKGVEMVWFLGTLPLLVGQASGREEPSWLGIGHLGAKSMFEGWELLSRLDEGVTFRVGFRAHLGLV